MERSEELAAMDVTVETHETTVNGGGAGGSAGFETSASSGGTVQAASERVRAAASEVADRVPEAVGSAQTAAAETARTLNEMPDQTLMLGAAFSVGLGVGLFLTGTNRLGVLLALAPAAAMAATIFNRQSEREPLV